jgi:hypothetical protein
MELVYLQGEDNNAYFTKGHVCFEEFMDTIGKEQFLDVPEHIWLRTTRDFQENRTVYEEAVPNSRGAFKATWVDVY